MIHRFDVLVAGIRGKQNHLGRPQCEQATAAWSDVITVEQRLGQPTTTRSMFHSAQAVVCQLPLPLPINVDGCVQLPNGLILVESALHYCRQTLVVLAGSRSSEHVRLLCPVNTVTLRIPIVIRCR